MPILAREPDLFPEELLEGEEYVGSSDQQWCVLHTRSRCEKQLMRHLLTHSIPFYSPTIPRRYRSSSGRLRVCYDLLFSNYVFVCGDELQQHTAATQRSVARCLPVPDGAGLWENLRTIQRLIEVGQPLTPEARLQAGDRVRVRSGLFAGFEGVVIRRENQVRLLVTVDFTRQGASVLLDDCQLEAIV